MRARTWRRADLALRCPGADITRAERPWAIRGEEGSRQNQPGLEKTQTSMKCAGPGKPAGVNRRHEISTQVLRLGPRIREIGNGRGWKGLTETVRESRHDKQQIEFPDAAG
eukprot:2078250-Pyramimonas_sp.AAC.1